MVIKKEEFDSMSDYDELEAIPDAGVMTVNPSKVTIKQDNPGVQVYHLQYNAEGEIYDYHIDKWYYPKHIVYEKLGKRDTEGRPIWVVRLPANAKKAVGTYKCRDEKCGLTFMTPLDLEQHMRSHHRTLWEVEKREEEQKQTNAILKLLDVLVQEKREDKEVRQDMLKVQQMLARYMTEPKGKGG